MKKLKRMSDEQLRKSVRFFNIFFIINALIAANMLLLGTIGWYYQVAIIWIVGYLLAIIYLALMLSTNINLNHSIQMLEMRHLAKKKYIIIDRDLIKKVRRYF